MAWFVDYGGIDKHRPTQTYENIYDFYSQMYFDKKKAKRLSNLTIHHIKRLKAKGKSLYVLYRDFIITTDKYKEGEIIIMKNFYDVMDYVKEVYEDCFCHEDDEETANDFLLALTAANQYITQTILKQNGEMMVQQAIIFAPSVIVGFKIYKRCYKHSMAIIKKNNLKENIYE